MGLIDDVKKLIQPILINNDVYLDDIIYEKESNEWYLRIYIEKNNGTLDMDTCVAASEQISDALDAADMISNEYYLEVSSPGVEKPLRTFEQVQTSIGEYVYAQLINPSNGLDEVEGYIISIDEDRIIEFEYLVKNIKKKVKISYDNIKFIRLAVKF